MEDNNNRFNYFEKIFLRISLSLMGTGFVLFILMFVFVDDIREYADEFSSVVAVLLIASFISFFNAIFRILKYIISVSKRNDGSTIKGSIISFFTSPVAIIIYYIMMIVIAFSSCTIQ